MPPIDFKKVFADKTRYPDTMKFTLGDGAEVSLADLREYDASVGNDLRKELDRQMKALNDDRAKVDAASTRVAQMYVDLEAQRASLTNVAPPLLNTNPLAKYEEDEVFRPVMQHIHGMEAANAKALTDVTSKLDQVVKSIAQMGTTYMGDKAVMDFSSLPADDPVRPADLTLDGLYKFAVEQRVYDRNNLPDLKTAYNKLTAADRYKHDVAAAREAGRAEARQELSEGAMLPRPSSGPPAPPDGVKPPINLQDAFSKAGTDRDMWKTIQNAAGLLQ